MALVRSPKEPQGATYTLSDGSTVTKTGETISSETQYYNVVQVTKGSLTLDGCTLTKTGDGTSGDDSSFYGTNSAVYASGSEAVINMTGGTITTSSQGANAIFATNGATINVSGVLIEHFTFQNIRGGNHLVLHLLISGNTPYEFQQ